MTGPGRPAPSGGTTGVIARAAGPLGSLIQTDRTRMRGRTTYALATGANPLVVLHRVAFIADGGGFDKDASRSLLTWAQEHNLGQDRALIAAAGARRERAVAQWRDAGRHRRILVRPLWRLAVGLGNRDNPHEIGLSLHGTYGWPVLPGSTLKGLTCAWATANGAADHDPALFDAVFGLPRVGGPAGTGVARRGVVTFLDALPTGGPVTVTRDVVTPHVQPYYRNDPQPPAEYHNPIPSEFLTISAGTFAVDLIAPQPADRAAECLERAAAWCTQAVDDLGVGAKTAAGYGYLTAEDSP